MRAYIIVAIWMLASFLFGYTLGVKFVTKKVNRFIKQTDEILKEQRRAFNEKYPTR